MLKNIAIGVGVAVVAGAAYFGIRKFKKPVKADLNKAALDAVNTAIDQVEQDLKDLAGNPDRIDLKMLFTAKHILAEKVDFDPTWPNGTGYFNGAVNHHVEVGDMKAATAADDRRLLLIGTEHGTIVLFERYTEGHGPFVVVSNTPRELKVDVPSGSIDVERLAEIFAKYVK